MKIKAFLVCVTSDVNCGALLAGSELVWQIPKTKITHKEVISHTLNDNKQFAMFVV